MKRAKNTAKTPGPVGAPHILSPDDRAAAGKALRDKVPREWHGGWKEFKGRPNPIDVLHKSDAGRMKELVPIRYGRMLQSPAEYRNSDVMTFLVNHAGTVFQKDLGPDTARLAERITSFNPDPSWQKVSDTAPVQ